MRRVLAASLLLATVATAAACTAQPNPEPEPTASSGSSTPSPTPFSGDMRTLLVPIPNGATARTVEEAPDGTVDLQQAAQIWLPNNPTLAQETLEGRFYEDGAIVSWVTAEESVVVQLFRFSDRLSARGFQGSYETYVDSLPGFERREEVSGIDGATVMVVALDDGMSGYAIAHKGPFVIRILYVADTDEFDSDRLSELLEQQYELLP